MKQRYRRSMLKLAAVLVVLSSLLGMAYLAGQNLDLLMQDETIFYAASQGDVELIERWLRWGTDINCKDANTGMTPLHLACWVANTNSIEVLLRRGANVNATDIYGRTPLEGAASRGHRNVVDRLQKSGATFTLRAAVLLRDLDSVKRLVEAHPDDVGSLIKPNVDMNTELSFIVQTPEILLYLLHHGLDPNVRTLYETESTPSNTRMLLPCCSLLMKSVGIDAPKQAAALLEHGARFRWPEESGSVFSYLRRRGNPEILRLLREYDAIPAKDIPPDLQSLL